MAASETNQHNKGNKEKAVYQPRDQLEAMLAAQMAAVHKACMRFASQSAYVETLPQQDSFAKLV